VPLAGLTTLGVGGSALAFLDVADPGGVVEALSWAEEQSLPVFVLGGGSNLLISDQGWPGLVLRSRDESCSFVPDGSEVVATVGAGLDWDFFVSKTVAMGLAGLECMSGIPGFVGGAPIQNIGAYGQEVSETIEEVQFVDRASGQLHTISGEDCGFSYRQSRFKGEWADRCVVTEVRFRLRSSVPPTLRYPELARKVASAQGGEPTLASVREAVLQLRRGKGMVLDPADPNTRSAGSFFMNPQLEPDGLVALEDELERRGIPPEELPRFPASLGRVKVPAAWLIERAGFRKGQQLGRAAISSRHSLALINSGGATSAEILALAGLIRSKVREQFGVTLHPEARFIGFGSSVDRLLDTGSEKD